MSADPLLDIALSVDDNQVHPLSPHTGGRGCVRRVLGALGWWLLGRWLAVPLVVAATLVDTALSTLRLLKRHAIDLPLWHATCCDPIGLVLQLALQLPLGTTVAVLFPAMLSLFVIPLCALCGEWGQVGGLASFTGLATAVPLALAMLPLFGGSANSKAHALCTSQFVGAAQLALGGGSRGEAAATGARGGGMKLCACLESIKGGVLPIDRLALALVKQALGTLAQLIWSQDDEVLKHACLALSYLAHGPNEKIQAVIESGVVRRLVELLMHPQSSVQTPALRTVGNIVTGDDLQTQLMLNGDALPCLRALLHSQKEDIRKEACWTLSNITAGNKQQIQAVIDADVLPPLIQLLANAELAVRKEAAWVICNATSGGTPQQIKYLVQVGCIRPLCDLLVVADKKIIAVALEGLENILKVGDEEMRQGLTEENDMARFVDEAEGLSKIEFLQQHEHAAWPRTSCESWAWTSDIYDKAVKIIETYFSQEEDDKDDDMPPLDDEEANVCVERDHHSALDRIHVTGHHGGIELDDTDDTVDDLAEQFDMMKELQDALGRSCDVGDDADEAHLESELDLVHSAVHLPPAALLPLGARVSDAAGDPGTIIDTNCSYTVRYDSGKTCYNVSKGLTLSTGDPDDFDFANHAEDTDDEEYMSNLWPGSPEYTSAPSKSALNVFSCEYDCGFISDFDTVSAHECACPMHPGTAGSTA